MKKTMFTISGQALVGEELELLPVDIIIENGIISSVEETRHAPMEWICPAFFNAHTHLGDTIAMDCQNNGDLESLVTPPHGLKHRILASAPPENLIAGIHVSIQGVTRGRAGCGDFREGGYEGVTALKSADGLPWAFYIWA